MLFLLTTVQRRWGARRWRKSCLLCLLSDSGRGKPRPSAPVALMNHLSGPGNHFCFSAQSPKSHLQSTEHKLTSLWWVRIRHSKVFEKTSRVRSTDSIWKTDEATVSTDILKPNASKYYKRFGCSEAYFWSVFLKTCDRSVHRNA